MYVLVDSYKTHYGNTQPKIHHIDNSVVIQGSDKTPLLVSAQGLLANAMVMVDKR
jgi:hypothetical protein